MRSGFVIFLILLIACSATRSPSAKTIYSQHVKDSFELYIDLPQDYKKGSNYSVVFYMDANLKSGKELRRQINLDSNMRKLGNVIFVGIGHIGDYRVLRRRDLIPPVIKGNDTMQSKDPEFGHADKFYLFLTSELIPYVNEHYPNNGKYTFMGHSFGGLFAFYCFTKPGQPFKNLIAMSPSLWVNNNNFFESEMRFYKYQLKTDVLLYHSCGTGEWINKVLYTSRKMQDTLNTRNYPGLRYIYSEHEGKDHNGVVPVSLEYVLQNIDL